MLKNSNGAFVRFLVCIIAFTKSSILYGQEYPEGSHSVILPGHINSGFEESKPIASATGDTLYFVRSFHPDNIGGKDAGSDIWVTYRSSDGSWSVPSNKLGSLNTPDHDQVIGLSGDGSILYTIKYFLDRNKRYINIMQSKHQASGWSDPSPVGLMPILLPGGYHEFYMHSSGKILLMSMKGLDTVGEEDLYLLRFTEEAGWSKPVNLGVNINTSGFEISPFLSHDMTHLYFASNGLGGLGDSDIYVSTRLGESLSDWSEPEHLGNDFNSNRFDAFYFQNQIGDIYFTSNRNKTNSDIFTLDASNSLLSPDTATAKGKNDTKTGISHQEEQRLVLYFDLDQKVLSPSELKRLEGFCKGLSKSLIQNIEIIGYTDYSGSANYNMELSMSRAINTEELFKKLLRESVSIEAYGKGVYHQNQNPDKMRRVEIVAKVTR